MNDIRRKRLEKRIQILISELYFKELKNPKIGFATFTGCELNTDGSHAQIYVSVYEDEAARQATIAGLERASGFIRSRIKKNIRMRLVPELHFVLDDSLEKAEKINQILQNERESAANGTENAD